MAQLPKEVERFIQEANEMLLSVCQEKYDTWIWKDAAGENIGECGSATVITFNGRSRTTRTLKQLGCIKYSHRGQYSLRLAEYPTQILKIHEAGATAAADFLSEKLGQKFYMHSIMD